MFQDPLWNRWPPNKCGGVSHSESLILGLAWAHCFRCFYSNSSIAKEFSGINLWSRFLNDLGIEVDWNQIQRQVPDTVHVFLDLVVIRIARDTVSGRHPLCQCCLAETERAFKTVKRWNLAGKLFRSEETRIWNVQCFQAKKWWKTLSSKYSKTFQQENSWCGELRGAGAGLGAAAGGTTDGNGPLDGEYVRIESYGRNDEPLAFLSPGLGVFMLCNAKCPRWYQGRRHPRQELCWVDISAESFIAAFARWTCTGGTLNALNPLTLLSKKDLVQNFGKPKDFAKLGRIWNSRQANVRMRRKKRMPQRILIQIRKCNSLKTDR